ncbi:MAG: CRISPR-associated protein Csx15 [bacterium]|nr:CRISPR-associated protein Csx15 [bacterium]
MRTFLDNTVLPALSTAGDKLAHIFADIRIWVPSAVVAALVVWSLGLWNFLEPFTGVISMVAILVAVAQTRKATVAIRGSATAGPLTIVNMSGHPLRAFEADWGTGAIMVDHAIHLNIDTTDALRDSVIDALMTLPDAIRSRLMAADPNVVLVPPNLPAGVMVMDAVLHGIVGEFVRISWSRRVDGGGFVWMKPVDRQAIRLEARHRLRVDGAFKPTISEE